MKNIMAVFIICLAIVFSHDIASAQSVERYQIAGPIDSTIGGLFAVLLDTATGESRILLNHPDKRPQSPYEALEFLAWAPINYEESKPSQDELAVGRYRITPPLDVNPTSGRNATITILLVDTKTGESFVLIDTYPGNPNKPHIAHDVNWLYLKWRKISGGPNSESRQDVGRYQLTPAVDVRKHGVGPQKNQIIGPTCFLLDTIGQDKEKMIWVLALKKEGRRRDTLDLEWLPLKFWNPKQRNL